MKISKNQEILLTIIHEDPDQKFIGEELNELNYLSSIGLAKHAGGLRYNITNAGIEKITIVKSKTKT